MIYEALETIRRGENRIIEIVAEWCKSHNAFIEMNDDPEKLAIEQEKHRLLSNPLIAEAYNNRLYAGLCRDAALEERREYLDYIRVNAPSVYAKESQA